MASLIKHQSAAVSKILMVGDSGTGKSGSLMSLICAGYKLRILDWDNGIDILHNYLVDPNSPYAEQLKKSNIDLEDAVRYVTLTDPMRSVRGKVQPAKAIAWAKGMSLLDNWKTEDEDLGEPRNWGPDVFLVIDSLTFAADRALNYIQSMNGRLGVTDPSYELQREMGAAQNQIEGMLKLIYDEGFKTNVIAMSHIVFRNPEGTRIDDKDSDQRGYPSAIGKALSPRIPRYFNNTLQLRSYGAGTAARKKIYTTTFGQVDLKNAAPTKLRPDYPIETGLADIVKALRA